MLRDFTQNFDFFFLAFEIVFMGGNFAPVTTILLRQVDIFLSQLYQDSLLLNLKIFVRELNDLLLDPNKEIIDTLNDILARSFW